MLVFFTVSSCASTNVTTLLLASTSEKVPLASSRLFFENSLLISAFAIRLRSLSSPHFTGIAT